MKSVPIIMRRLVLALLLIGGVGLPMILTSFHKSPSGSGPFPPDLESCTRIEIQRTQSLEDRFFRKEVPYMLTPDEIKFFQPFNKKVIEDKRLISKIAKQVKKGLYDNRGAHVPPRETMKVTCFNGDQLVTSFYVMDGKILVDGKNWFEYRWSLSDLTVSVPNQKQKLRPYQLRLQCTANLRHILSRIATIALKEGSYPDPKEWCDKVIGFRKGRESSFRSNMICPESATPKASGSDYAMNANCKKESPDDMVLLFESKPGWNQYGGPELFFLDNHDPKGGCVILKGGTCKFVRTHEEAQQLRWQ
jgi:hypothetical protein